MKHVYGAGRNDYDQLAKNECGFRAFKLDFRAQGIKCIALGGASTIILYEDGEIKYTGCRITKANKRAFELFKNGIKYITSGDWHTLILTNDNNVVVSDEQNVRAVEPKPIIRIFSFAMHAAFIDSENHVYLLPGDMNGIQASKGKYFIFGEKIIEVAVSLNRFHALSESGRVYSSNSQQIDTLNFYEEPSLLNIKFRQISGYNFHCIALSKEGDVFVRGKNDFAQLGNGTLIDSDSFIRINTQYIPRIKQVEAGSSHSFILTEENDLYSFGRNEYGQLFHDAGTFPIPTLVNLGKKEIVYLARPTDHSIVVTQPKFFQKQSLFDEDLFQKQLPKKKPSLFSDEETIKAPDPDLKPMKNVAALKVSNVKTESIDDILQLKVKNLFEEAEDMKKNKKNKIVLFESNEDLFKQPERPIKAKTMKKSNQKVDFKQNGKGKEKTIEELKEEIKILKEQTVPALREEIRILKAAKSNPYQDIMQEASKIGNSLVDPCLFKKIKKIGKGRFGSVYLVERIEDKAVFAMKKYFIKSNGENNYETEKRFIRELEIGVEINHPCITKFFGHSLPTKNTPPILYIEFAPNGSLEEIISRNPVEWTPTSKMICVLNIVLGMRCLHKNHIVHRDLKPSNILCFGFSKFKISDFSESTICSDDITMTGGVGSVFFMSPEIMNEDNYDEKTDVFSFGSVLFNIVTGEIPRMKMSDLIRGIRCEIPPNVNNACRELINNCWNQSPSSRPTFDDILISLEVNSFNLIDGADSKKVFQEFNNFGL